MITCREIKVRYKQTLVGCSGVLMPLVIVCAGLVVRVGLGKVSGTPLALSGHDLRHREGCAMGLLICSLIS